MAHKTTKKKHLSFRTLVSRFWRSKLFFIVGVILLVFISSSVVKEIVRQVSIKHDIRRLEEEIAQLEERNNEISSLLQSLNSSSTLEKEARTKLGVQKTGETLVSLGNPIVSQPTLAELEQTKIDTRSNVEKWIDSFTL